MRPFDPDAFLTIRDEVLHGEHVSKGIGTLSEKSLHVIFKYYYEPLPSLHEQKLGKYVADILNEDGVIEIQTRNLSSMKEKLKAFTAVTHVTLVHPVVRKKWIQWLDEDTGALTEKRKSPKSGTLYDAFWELLFIRDNLKNPNLSVCLPLIDAEDIRYLNGYGNNRKRGSSRCERVPVALISETVLSQPEDWLIFIPESLTESRNTFTRKEFALAVHQPQDRAVVVMEVLEAVGVLQRAGKQGRSYLYRVSGNHSGADPES